MDGRHFIPTNAAKPTFTSLPVLVTVPPLPQAATTGTNIFEQPPNAMTQAQPEIGQSQQIQNFAYMLVGNVPTIVYPQNPEWSEEEEDWDGVKQKEKECKEEESKDSKQKELKETLKLIICQALNMHPVSTQVPTVMASSQYSPMHWCQHQKKI